MNPRDPGLQPERTALAWTRTGIAMAVNAVIVVRTGIAEDTPGLIMAGMVIAGLSIALIVLARVRRRQLQATEPCGISAGLALFASAASVFAACCGCWAIL